MTKATSVISILVLVIFVGLLGFGLIANNSDVEYQHHVTCAGVDCGPVDHILLHHYVVADMFYYKSSVDQYYKNPGSVLTIPASYDITLEPPPPKQSLV